MPFSLIVLPLAFFLMACASTGQSVRVNATYPTNVMLDRDPFGMRH